MRNPGSHLEATVGLSVDDLIPADDVLALRHGLTALRADAGEGPDPDLVGIRFRAAEHAVRIFHLDGERVLGLYLV